MFLRSKFSRWCYIQFPCVSELHGMAVKSSNEYFPSISPYCNEVFILHCTFVISFTEHNGIFVQWQPVAQLIHDLFYILDIYFSPHYSKTQLYNWKTAHVKSYLEREDINFWQVSCGTNQVRKKFCYVFWNQHDLNAFVIEHCALGCNCKLFLQCSRAVR